MMYFKALLYNSIIFTGASLLGGVFIIFMPQIGIVFEFLSSFPWLTWLAILLMIFVQGMSNVYLLSLFPYVKSSLFVLALVSIIGTKKKILPENCFIAAIVLLIFLIILKLIQYILMRFIGSNS